MEPKELLRSLAIATATVAIAGPTTGCVDESETNLSETEQEIYAGDPFDPDYSGVVCLGGANGCVPGCTGTLLSSTWALTAAHCTDGSTGAPSGLYIGQKVWMGTQQSTISAMFAHAGYDYDNFSGSHDLALVRLSSPLSMNVGGYHKSIRETNLSVGANVNCYGYSFAQPRTGIFSVSSVLALHYGLPTNGRGQRFESGDSGGPCLNGPAPGGELVSVLSAANTSIGYGVRSTLFHDWANEFTHVWSKNRQIVVMADVDGDDLDDIVGFGSMGVWVSRSLGALSTPNDAQYQIGFLPPELWLDDEFDYTDWLAQHPRYLVDLDNDDRADIVGFGEDGVWVALSTGTGFSPPVREISTQFGNSHGWDTLHNIRLATDINGDQRADLVGFGDDGVWVALATGSTPNTFDGFTTPTRVLTDFGYNQGWTVSSHPRTLADVNNDGFPDIVGFGAAGVYVSLGTGSTFGTKALRLSSFGTNQGWSSQHPRHVTDLNGDGKADLVGFGSNGVWVALSQYGTKACVLGTCFSTQTMMLGEFGYNQGWDDQRPRVLARVNADSAPDIVGFDAGAVRVALGTSTGDFSSSTVWASDFGENQGWSVYDDYRFLAAANGGALADIVGFDDRGVWVATSTGTNFAAKARWIAAYAMTP